MTLQNRRLTGIVSAVAFLLLIPFIAMQFTTEINWSLFDFVLMGSLLLGTGLAVELVWRKVKKLEHRLALGGAVLLVLFLIWAELAVGIFGSAFAGS